jgi:hypothetical protein
MIKKRRKLVKYPIERIVFSKIDCDWLAGYTLLFDFFRRLRKRLNITPRNNQLASFARQRDGDGAADPVAGASHQTFLIFQYH